MRRRSAILVALAAAACHGPPALLPPDGGVIDGTSADARLPDAVDAALPDAPVPDAALPDAPPPDAAPLPDAPPDAGPPDADLGNPYGIHLTDQTVTALGGYMLGGRDAIDLWGVGTGAAIGDVNGDGMLDIILARCNDLSSAHPGGPTQLLRNTGPSSGFVSFVADMGLSLSGIKAHGVALGDYDNDGDLDAFIAAEGHDLLMENDGTGAFADVTAWSGVFGRGDDISVGAMWVDVNHDGMLDLYVANHTAASPPYPDVRAANRLYINIGDGIFQDVSMQSETDSDGSTQVAAAFDLDGTGDLVIYAANDRFFIDGASAFADPSLLPGDTWYHLTSIDDQGVPTFSDLALDRGVYDGRSSMGVGIADVDGDLTPDVYVSDWGGKDLYLNPTPGGPTVYGSDTFKVSARRDAFGYNMISWGVKFLDLDRDGLLELYIVNGGVGEPLSCDAYHQLDWYLRAPAPGVPWDVITGSVGLPTDIICFADEPVVGRGAITGDLDGDGDDDLVITPYIEAYRVYQNDTPLGIHHELRLRLRGTVSSVDPIGATVIVTKLDGTQLARYRYAGGDTLSQSDSLIRVGLGDDTGVTDATIYWPSGLVQRIDGLPGFGVDATFEVVEPAWLTVSPRLALDSDPTPQLVYTAVDDTGAPLGAAGAGRILTVTRSDGLAVDVTDNGDGTYVASLPHPGIVRRTVLTITVDGVPLRPRPLLRYR